MTFITQSYATVYQVGQVKMTKTQSNENAVYLAKYVNCFKLYQFNIVQKIIYISENTSLAWHYILNRINTSEYTVVSLNSK